MFAARLVVTAALLAAVAAMPSTATAQGPGADIQASDASSSLRMELGSARFELASSRAVAAARRLEWLRGTSGWRAAATAADDAELRFLLARAYFHLGASTPFRSLAEPMLHSSERDRAATLRVLLVFDAYQRGDAARATSLASASQDALVRFIAGLSCAEQGNAAQAQSLFTQAALAGGELERVARYMAALMLAAAEPSRTMEAVDLLRGVASGDDELSRAAVGAAAQLAYAVRRYDVATQLSSPAARAGDRSPLTARLHAWSLYHSGETAAASGAFAELADRHGDTPEGNEARVMAAQAMLDAGRRSTSAEHFVRAADALGVRVAELASFDGPRATAAARSVVAARETAMLFSEIGRGPLGVELPRMSVVSGDASVRPVLMSIVLQERWIADLLPRLGLGFPHSLLRQQSSGRIARAEHTSAALALREADVEVAMAAFALHEAQARHDVAIRQSGALGELVGTERQGLAKIERRLQSTQDSLVSVLAAMGESRERVRRLLREQIEATRALAAENARLADTLRGRMGNWMNPAEAQVLTAERSASVEFTRLAEIVAGGLDGVIVRHPVFARHDSVTAHVRRNRMLLAEARAQLASTERVAHEAGERGRSTEDAGITRAHAALGAAEQQRSAAEGRLTRMVEAELNARAARWLAELRRLSEVAEFGSATALFFAAIEAESAASAQLPPASLASEQRERDP